MQTLTPVDTFTATVQGVSDGDAPTASNLNTAAQGVLNRTQWLGNRTGIVCTGTFTADTGLVTNAYLNLNNVDDLGTGNFALTDTTRITVPAAGVYIVHFYTNLVSDSATDALNFQVSVYAEDTIQQSFAAKRANNDPVKAAHVQGLYPVTISNASTERIRFRLQGVTGNISVENTSCFTVWRVA
jgi:hypothetical protein